MLFNRTNEYVENLVELKRVSKVITGGKRLKLYACVVVGDGAGKIGMGHAKASEVAPAIRKATEIAKKSMVKVNVTEDTILHNVQGKYSASRVILRPAMAGTGVIACKAVRSVCEAAGIKNILSKSLGSNNPTNLARATINALKSIRSFQTVAELRNKPIEYFFRKEYEKAQGDTEEKSN
jgi:small subunit ribosomal protein S5